MQNAALERERFVGDLALTDDVRRTGQIKVADGEVLAVDIHVQRTAGNIDSDTLAADRALEGQNCDDAAGAGPAGVGEVLHASLKGFFHQMVRANQVIEIHVRALGEGRVTAQGLAQWAQLVKGQCLQAGHFDDGVG